LSSKVQQQAPMKSLPKFSPGSGILAAAIAVGLVYSICLLSQPRHTFWSPDEGGKYLQVETLRWNHGVEFKLAYGGEELDPDLRFYAHHGKPNDRTFIYPIRDPDGTYRFHWALVFSYIAKLPTVLLGPTGGYLVAMLAGWVAAIVAGLVARELAPPVAVPAILVVGFASPVWFYGLCFWEHTSAAMCALFAVYALVRASDRVSTWLIAALLSIAAVTLRVELAAFLAALSIVLVMSIVASRLSPSAAVLHREAPTRGRGVVLLLVAGGLLAMLWLVYTGRLLSGRHAHLLWNLPARFERLGRLPAALGGILAAPYWTGAPLLSYAGARAGLAGLLLGLVAPVFRRTWIEGSLTLIGLGIFAIYALSLVGSPAPYRSLHGVFPIAPFMIFAGHGVVAVLGRGERSGRMMVAITLAYMITGIAAFSLVYIDAGGGLALGLAWGQRYLLLLYPLLSILSLVGMRAYWRSPRPIGLRMLALLLAFLLIGTGVAFQVRGYRQSRDVRVQLAEWQAAMEEGPVVITDIWWLPAAVAEFYTRKPIFVVEKRADVAGWLQTVRGLPVARFTFASLSPVRLSQLGEPRPKMVVPSQRKVDGIHLTTVSFLTRGGRRRWP
jgi:hypothetical protein